MRRLTAITLTAIMGISATTLAFARGSSGGGHSSGSSHAYGGTGRSPFGGSRSYAGGTSYSRSTTFRSADRSSISSTPRFSYGSYSLRSRTGSFYRLVNGRYTDATIVGRITNTVPAQYLRSATVNGRTYRWDARTAFPTRIYSTEGDAYLGSADAPGPRASVPYAPAWVYRSTYFPHVGYAGGWYRGDWYGPSFSDLLFWDWLSDGALFGDGYREPGWSGSHLSSYPLAQNHPTPAPSFETNCSYFDINGHPVDVTVIGDHCPQSTDTSTPPPDSVNVRTATDSDGNTLEDAGSQTPDPQRRAASLSAPSVPCEYYDSDGKPVDVQAMASTCPVTSDTTTPPPTSWSSLNDGEDQ